MGLRDDGHYISESIPQYEKPVSLDRYFGLMKVKIEEVIYLNDSRNSSFERYGFRAVQYLCRIIGSQYDGSYIQGVIDSTDLGGEFNYSEVIRSGVENQALETPSGDVEPKFTNGDFALVLSLYGSLKRVIIIRGFPHPRNKRIGSTKEEGKRNRQEYNGIETHIDKNGNYRVRIVGQKNSKGEIENPSGVGSEFILHRNGDFEFNAYGTTSDTIPGSSSSKDCKIVFSKADKKVEVFGGGGVLKLANGKVGLGSSSVELLEQISNQLDKLVTMIGSMETEVHTGNLGYPTGPPTNSSDYATAKGELLTIKSKIESIKGGV